MDLYVLEHGSIEKVTKHRNVTSYSGNYIQSKAGAGMLLTQFEENAETSESFHGIVEKLDDLTGQPAQIISFGNELSGLNAGGTALAQVKNYTLTEVI